MCTTADVGLVHHFIFGHTDRREKKRRGTSRTEQTRQTDGQTAFVTHEPATEINRSGKYMSQYFFRDIFFACFYTVMH